MKAIILDDLELFNAEIERLDELETYHSANLLNDNGGEPDGNAWLVLIKELPPEFQVNKFKIVEVNKIPYNGGDRIREKLNKNKKWCGWSSRNYALIMSERADKNKLK